MTTRSRVSGALLLLVLTAIVSSAIGPASAPVRAAAPVPGRTLLVSGSLPAPDPHDPAALRPAVNAAGTEVVYSVQDDDGVTRRLLRRNLLTTRTEVVSPRGRDSTAPASDAAGDTIAYVSSRGRQDDGASDVAVVVAQRRDGRWRQERISTPVPGLPAEHSIPCSDPHPVSAEAIAPEPCGPAISADGRSVAYPAMSSSDSSTVPVVPEDPLEFTDAVGASAHARVLDFGVGVDVRVLTVPARPTAPLRITGARISKGAGRFALVAASAPDDCRRGVVPVDGSCSLEVRMTRGAACGPVFGRLSLTGPPPVGPIPVVLVGLDLTGCAGRPGVDVRRSSCPDSPSAPAAPPVDRPPLLRLDAGIQLGRHLTGSVDVRARLLRNDLHTAVRVGFAADGCGVRLLDPVDDGPGGACTPGEVLRPGEWCTAHLMIRAPRVATLAAALTLTPLTWGPPTLLPIVADTVREVVVIRRDADGDGTFTGPADPPPRIVSRDDGGDVVDGRSPSLSADGRFVAFTSTRAGLLPGARVLVHDTDRRGDRTYLPGGTTRVPDLHVPGVAPLMAGFSPSISADGRRVAYVAYRLLETDVDVRLASPGPGIDVDATIGALSVEVRDLRTGAAAVASAPDGSTRPADGLSQEPRLAADGRTVAFVSDSRRLRPRGDDAHGTGVYLRDLGPDLARLPDGGPELQSVPVAAGGAGSSAQPALSANGGMVAFASTGTLTEHPRVESPQVFARLRSVSASVTPQAVDYPPQPLGARGSVRQVRVENSGLGPIRVDAGVRGPFTATGCRGSTLHRGESCRVEVRFVPRSLGPQDGQLTISTTAVGWPSRTQIVALSGTAVPAVIELRPGEITFPAVGVGRSGRRQISVRNVAEVPVTVAADVRGDDTDFSAAADSCADLEPRATCRVTVEFSPRTLGDQDAVVEISSATDAGTVTQELPVSATTLSPVLSISPAVARAGAVVLVSGENFPPGRITSLTWDGGSFTTPEALPDAAGSFAVPVVVLDGVGPGSRTLRATTPLDDSSDLSATAPSLLVVPGSAQPPDFLTRD